MNKIKPFKTVQRLMAMLLSVVMIFGMMPFTASAENEPPLGQSNCTHVHGECSFVEGVACTHVHDETCGENGVDCTHIHDENCGFVQAVACDHVHDATCGGLVAEPEPAPQTTPVIITAFDPSPYHNPSDLGTTYIVVDKGTAIVDIPLPTTLMATAENGEQNAYSVAVSEWTCATYDPQTPEVYVFTPTLALKANESLKDGVTPPTVEVVVTANLGIVPMYTAGELASQINGWNGGGTGSLSATQSGNTVTVTGTVTGATNPLILYIDAGVTVLWSANLTNTTATNFTVSVNGTGKFELASGSITRNLSLGAALYLSDVNSIISGGTASTISGGTAVAISYGTLTMTGGAAEAPNGYAISVEKSIVAITGGSVSSNNVAFKAKSSSVITYMNGTKVSGTDTVSDEVR